jgi:hypothetical protein
LMGVGRGKKMEIKKTGIHKCWIWNKPKS